ncbi:MAG: BrnT family toxin [Polyangiales bacterium]|nr:BrnT family toxin [Myxococcales bacterium]MCB9659399.1 BrnT family toxin [Sandaracinaceae bacterium]
MPNLRFEWDERKNSANRRKHQVGFEEAQTAFADDLGLVIDDPDHSHDEERFVLLGMSSAPRLLVVCHCVREAGDVIRIISARKANTAERRAYHER